ncbi:hypothetical protein B0A48_00129 [Cryoendolithus antarcticus]|uniref:PNPLA domain-containing protein n=1 Tax=Cryoendolithus antarcticus TaxID=1507870 RepID=A0A1V8TTU5_9PEZI|nr:hypothetical protein B0A48_00129 [Cryoendolithus antarcticus]
MGSLDFPSLSFGDFSLPSFELPPLTAKPASDDGPESGEEEDTPRESSDGGSWVEQSTAVSTGETDATELSKQSKEGHTHSDQQWDTAPPQGVQPALSRRFSYESGGDNDLSVVTGADEEVPGEVTGANGRSTAELPWAETPQDEDDAEFQRVLENSRQTAAEDERRRSKRLAVGAGTIPHEKTDQSVARKVRDVLTPDLRDEEREQLHIADIDTTWFGVVREGHERPLFRDYGRYANLIAGAKDLRMESATALSATSDHSETLYPSLVSFVGQTGAGKSTLIKLLIDLKSEEDERFPTPVVGAVGRDVATSEDVHLYLDPDSSESQAPLLFADCEGLEGGERDPIGAKLKRKMESAQPVGPGGRRKPRLKHTSERELIWADTPKKQSREFAVAHLYPRLLYTFSDVICFVLRNPSVLERLVDWAAAALEKSSNQPVLPHAILVLNASENDIPEDLWDVDNATESLMESLARTVYQNSTFKRYAQFWRERNRSVESVQDLVLSYYSSLRVVRIPTTGRPKLIREQVEKLSDGIRWASKQSRERKLELRMLLDADDFAPYLSNAFDHFAENLNTPFDFVQASFVNSPIPNDFGGNILKLALQVMECWVDVAKAAPIFEELSYLVASSILLDAARHKIRGTAEQIFPQYLEHLDNALENFCDRHWPCEYYDPKRQGGRCVNVRSGHGAKGHQSKSGKLLAAGDYVSEFSFRDYQRVFQEDTYRMLVRLRERVQDKERNGNMPEEQAAAEVHKEMVLPYFFQHASRGNVRSFSHLNRYVEIPECPIEKRERRFRSAWKVNLKPASCGVRLLTLDGGGVRGIVELEILKQLERELGGRVSVQSFFDLIVGTSTGGIIALGLTARNWTVEQCTQHFEALCAKAFTLRKGMNMPGVGWLVSNYNHSMYETQPLQEALIEAFTEDQYLFGGQRSESGTMDVKVAVTATSAAGSAVVLANYNRFCTEKLSYMFHRPEKRNGELKTWEAARATSAAPKYFKPLCHETSKQIFSDGGIYHNNPIHIAERERRLIWPTVDEQGPDVIVSIGTLFCRKVKEKKSMRWTSSPRGIVAHGRFLTKLANDHLHTSLDSEKTWNEFLNIRAPRGKEKDRYIRINPEIDEHPPKLDDVGQMKKLQERTRLLVADDPRIKALAKRLVATSFYLDIVGDVREDVKGDLYEVTGYVHNRFIVGHEISELGKLLKAWATAGHAAHLLITEVDDGIHLPQEMLFDSKVINRMIQHQVFRMDPVTIRRSTKFAKTDISLCYTKGTYYPISGFPRLLHADKPVVTGLVGRHALTVASSVRWASRSRSQQQRRFDWTPPDILPPLGVQDILASYANPMHLLGSVTDENLLMMKSRVGVAGMTGRESNAYLYQADTHTTAGASAYSELEGTSARSELPASPAVQLREDLPKLIVELPATEASEIPKYWMADDDWSEARMPQPRAVGSIYMSLSCGDVLEVRKMPADGTWLVYRPSDQREGWVPSSCLRPLENHRPIANHSPRSPYSNSPIDGRPW